MSSSAEVVFILRTAQPAVLTFRLRGPAAFRCPTIALAPRTAGFAIVYLIAMQALEGWLGFHRRERNQAPHPSGAPAERTKSAPPVPSEENGEGSKKMKEEKCGAEALEENAAPRARSDFQTVRFRGFSLRRPQGLPSAPSPVGTGRAGPWGRPGSPVFRLHNIRLPGKLFFTAE